MRSSHPRRASTWSTTWFSAFWRQRIFKASTATSAAFVARALLADQAAAFEGPRPRKPQSRFPRHYYYTRTTGVNIRNTGADPKGAGATAVAPVSGALAATAGVAPLGAGATAAVA